MLVAGCAATPPALQDIDIPLRNPTARVASQVDADLSRLDGEWIVVKGAGIAPGAKLGFSRGTLAVNGVVLPLVDKGQGRLDLNGDALWVHWLDADNRTAALGDPGGGRVWIMDRTGRPGERLRAAQDILKWYGYDLSRME